MMDVRTGQAPAMLTREEFGQRFRMAHLDPLFGDAKDVIAQIEEIAWQAYVGGRKSPLPTRAGPGFSDPDFPFSVEWLATRQRLLDAQASWARSESPTRVLLVCGAARNDGTCPGEMSKTSRLLELIRAVFTPTGIQTDVLDLSFEPAETDDRSPGLRGRRQPRPDPHIRQEPRQGQRAGNERMGLPQAPGGVRVWAHGA